MVNGVLERTGITIIALGSTQHNSSVGTKGTLRIRCKYPQKKFKLLSMELNPTLADCQQYFSRLPKMVTQSFCISISFVYVLPLLLRVLFNSLFCCLISSFVLEQCVQNLLLNKTTFVRTWLNCHSDKVPSSS